MGICRSTNKIVVVQNPDSCDLDLMFYDNPLVALASFVEKENQKFEERLLGKITPNKPRGIVEFDHIFRKIVQISFQHFLNHFIPLPKLPNVVKDYNQFKVYLLSKCKAREGHFRCLNDYFSFEHNYNLKMHLIKDFSTELLTQIEVLEKYRKLAKGTFIIEGLQDMYEVMKFTDIKAMKGFIDEKAKQIRIMLEDNRKQLDRAERKAIIPIRVEMSPSLSIQDDPKEIELIPSSSDSIDIANLDSEFKNLYNSDMLILDVGPEPDL